MSESYAIVESGGKQYRAEKGTVLVVDRLAAEEGAKVSLPALMYRAGSETVLDGAELEKVRVEAVVAEHLRGPKVRVFKHRPKKGYRRRAGHRSELTRLEVREVKLLQRKPAAAKAQAGGGGEAEPRAAAAKPATKKPAARKPAARKPATTKDEG